MVCVEPSDSNSGLADTQCGHQSTPNMVNLASLEEPTNPSPVLRA